MVEPLNVEKVLEVIGYDDDPATVTTIGIGLRFLTVYRVDGQVRYYKTLPQPDGSIKLTNQDITWHIEWENLMNEGQVCGFCGKPGDDEKQLKAWISKYNDTRWFFHDPCLWSEMDRDELEEVDGIERLESEDES